MLAQPPKNKHIVDAHLPWSTEVLWNNGLVSSRCRVLVKFLYLGVRFPGALNYALGSHKHGLKGSTDLHTRKEYDDNERELIPEDPEKSGFKVKCMEMNPTDMVVHDGYTWHYSGPNLKENTERRGLSVRFIK